MISFGSEIVFERDKIFEYVKELGSGGTGDAVLVRDKEIDMLFAIKKYSPKNLENLEENYDRFIDEMKILFKISHPNIVRIYNYYLYPENKAGFLQMEYIEGTSIDEYFPEEKGEHWERIFLETLSAFEYLESIKILHRDIRPANIMIDKDSNVKIIDFGFGKKLDIDEFEGRSVVLNWPVTELPEEIVFSNKYNHSTEVYFLGNLFKNILKDELERFKYKGVIEKMCEVRTEERYSSFNEISLYISNDLFNVVEFTKNEKEIYLEIADVLFEKINYFSSELKVIETSQTVLEKLEDIIRRSALEGELQDNALLINCFVYGGYTYKRRRDIKVEKIISFYEMMKQLSAFKQKVVLDNIHTRLTIIDVKQDEFDDLPF